MINLLKNTISGKLGNTVGIVRGYINVIQTLPMGKTKYPPEEKEALQQFQCFVRFCNAMAKAFPDLYSKYNRAMTRKNYACKIFATCYTNRQWAINNAIDVIHSKQEIRIDNAQFDRQTQTMTITINITENYKPWKQEQLCVIGIAEDGKFICSIREPFLYKEIEIPAGTTPSHQGWIIAFLYRPTKTGYYTTGFTLNEYTTTE